MRAEVQYPLTRFIPLAQMGTPYFWWFNVTIPGGYVAGKTNPDGYNGGVAWFVGACRDVHQLGRMMVGLAPGLMSTALLFKEAKQPELLKSLRDAMRILPGGSVPPEGRLARDECASNGGLADFLTNVRGLACHENE